MSQTRITNALLSATKLTIDPCLNFTVWFEFDGCTQGFGGYKMDGDYSVIYPKGVKYSFCAEFIKQMIIVAGVDRWEDMVGEYCRIEYDYTRIYRVGHIVDNIWCDPEEIRKRCEP